MGVPPPTVVRHTYGSESAYRANPEKVYPWKSGDSGDHGDSKATKNCFAKEEGSGLFSRPLSTIKLSGFYRYGNSLGGGGSGNSNLAVVTESPGIMYPGITSR